MNSLPDFWRTEVWHPLSVHFPIALLSIASIFILLSFFSKNSFWSKSGSLLLIMGTLAAWISIFTGDLADGVVSRNICDPTVLKEHENAAYLMAYLFSAAAILDIFSKINGFPLKENYIRIPVLLLLIVANFKLVETGHLGASLVYQQAAGVHVPSADCAEFNE